MRRLTCYILKKPNGKLEGELPYDPVQYKRLDSISAKNYKRRFSQTLTFGHVSLSWQQANYSSLSAKTAGYPSAQLPALPRPSRLPRTQLQHSLAKAFCHTF